MNLHNLKKIASVITESYGSEILYKIISFSKLNKLLSDSSSLPYLRQLIGSKSFSKKLTEKDLQHFNPKHDIIIAIDKFKLFDLQSSKSDKKVSLGTFILAIYVSKAFCTEYDPDFEFLKKEGIKVKVFEKIPKSISEMLTY